MGRTASDRLTSSTCGTSAWLALAVLISAILSATGLVLGSATPVFAQVPAQVTLDGEWELNRKEHDPCIVAVPDVLRGTIHIEADFLGGTVTGSFEGGGAGSYTVPAVCNDENPDDYDFSHLETWTAEIPVVQATFSGALDPITGAFDVDAVVYAEGEGYRAAPGHTYWCGTESGTPTCDLGSFAGDQAAEVYGTIAPTGVNRGGVDWYTNYIALVSPSSNEWGPHGMTVGSWVADVTNVVWRENRAPEVGGIASSPADPTTDDAIVFSVEATDPDEDALTYAWYIDGTREGPSAPSVTWAKPTAGDHVIKVTVSDGGESVDAFLDLRVSEHVGAGDKDGDGVVDDEDLCPDEWGEGDDGCPPFAASLACTPVKPMPKDAVTCTATVAGDHVGEELVFDWYLDGGSQQSGEAATWTWPSAESGTHDIGVQAVGFGRSSDADLAIVVGGGLVDEATAGFHFVSLSCNSGVSSDDTLNCAALFERDREDVGPLAVAWQIDGAPAASEVVSGGSAGWSLAEPAPGDHTVTATLIDPATNNMLAQSTAANVTPGSNAMIPPALQAGAATATTLTAAAWLWLEWLRRRREEAGMPLAPVTDEDRYWDERNRAERAAARAEHQRFADDQFAKFTKRCRDQMAAENAAALAERRDRQLRMLKADRLEAIAEREGYDDLSRFLDPTLDKGDVPAWKKGDLLSWKQLEQVRNAIVRRGGDQAAMDRYFAKSDTRVFLEGCHDTLAWGTGKVAGAMTGDVGGRLAEWLVRNPEVPIRVAVAGLTMGKSELVLLPLDAWRNMEAAADQKMAEQNRELSAWEATKEVIKTGAWYVGGEVAGDVVSKWWSGGGTATREAAEEASEAAAKRAGAQTSDDFVRRVNAKVAAKRAAREAGEEIPDAAARRAAEAAEYGGHVSRTQDDYLRTFARDGDVVPANHLHEAGYTARDIKAASKICGDEGVEIYARTTNMDSMRHIRDGTALPKSLDIKAKTINELDTYLGARPSDKGLVGYFEPVQPDFSKVPAELQDQVRNRFAERLDEVAKLSKDAKFQGLIDDGVLKIEGGKIIDTATGKPFAGDIDAVFIKDKATGKYLTGGDRFERVLRRWKAEVGGQHGVEMNVVKDVTAPHRPGTAAFDEAFSNGTKLQHKLQAGHTTTDPLKREIVVRFDADGALRRGPRDINLTPGADQIFVEGAGGAARAAPDGLGGATGSTVGREWEGRPDA